MVNKISLLLAAVCTLIMVLANGQEELKSRPRTRDQVNAQVDKDSRTGVFFLSEHTFDDFINYNDLALVCFYETGDMEPILSELLAQVSRRV